MRRQVRGLLVISSAWGAAWGTATGAIGEPLADFVCGALSGAAFAAILAPGERRATVKRLRYSRVATWGILRGLALPAVLLGEAVALHGGQAFWLDRAMVAGALSAACGGVTTIVTLALARRGRPLRSHVLAT